MERTQQNGDARNAQNSDYIVTADNLEIGTVLLGSYECDSPEAAVREVLAGNYQSPAADPAYDIAAADASHFTVHEINAHSTTVSREAAMSTHNWQVSEHDETVSISYQGTSVIDIEHKHLGELIAAIGTVYPRPERVGGQEKPTERAPEYESFVDHNVGPIRIYPGAPEEDTVMWVQFTSMLKIPSVEDARSLLDLLTILYPDGTEPPHPSR